MRKLIPPYLVPFIAVAASFLLYAAALLATVLAPGTTGALLATAALAGVGAEVVLSRRPGAGRLLDRVGIDSTMRAALRDLVLVALAGASATDRPDVLRVVAPTLLVLWGLRTFTVVLQRANRDRRSVPVSWRNLEVPGVRRSTPPLGAGPFVDLARWPSSGSLALALGLAATVAGGSGVWLWLGAAVSLAAVAGALAVTVADTAKARGDSTVEETIEALGAALDVYAPEVVFYYSRPEAVGYIANVWTPTLEKLPHRVVVLTRESRNAVLVKTDVVPVVNIVRAVDLERLVPPSVKLAMYPSNVAKNYHLLRLPGIFDVFVGHGDSDKGGSATTLTRIFDEAWVSGPAARDRYRVADVGVRDEQIREVGRPQLAEIRTRAAATAVACAGGPDGPDEPPGYGYTVLYAPTREGFFRSWAYSSVLSQGEGILRSLMAAPGVRVLFKPHPGTGTDDPRYREEVLVLISLVEQAGAPHEVVTGSEGLYQSFNRADLLVSDVSSVITDFLASGRPYVVTNSTALDTDTFRATFPSARGAYVLDGDGTRVAQYVGDARESDSLSELRRRTAAHLLGGTDEDPLARFVRAVDDVIALQDAESARRG